MAPSARYRVGADENGLGPRLGPMIVTAVLARVSESGWDVASRRPRGALASRLGDSKAMVSHGDVALGEAWTRALVGRACGRPESGVAPAHPDELVHAVAADSRDHLRSPCPSHVAEQCWSPHGEAFEAPESLVGEIHKDLDKLAAKGVELLGVRAVILCSKRLNEGVDAGKNRFVLDLHAMERLILDFNALAGGEVHAVCGKVGGFGKYSNAFGPLGGRLHSVIEESRKRSAYYFPGVGELAFIQDSDASDMLVAMASMVGKYLREALMARVVRFYRGDQPELDDASGYHDPITARFVDATRLVRDRRNVPDSCFERRAMDSVPRT
jgi:hypothetical protein